MFKPAIQNTEQEGDILLLAYGDDGTEFLILNADDVASGPIFRPPLLDVSPYSFYDYFQNLKN